MRHPSATVDHWELTLAQDVLPDDTHVPVTAFGANPMMEFKNIHVSLLDYPYEWCRPLDRPVRTAVDTPVP